MTTEIVTTQDSPLAAMGGMQGNGTALAKLGQSREVTSVLASMFVAKQFPRDEMTALAKIKRACQRPRLAEMARYSFKRGSSIVEGPSIRIAEAVATAWGNIETGWREIERRMKAGAGVSVVEAFAWDMETNNRKSLSFEVRHWRDTKAGGYAITDERDIYELCANQAARRIRSCVLAIIPGDIVDEALAECDKTLSSANKGKPLADRIRDMVAAFQNDYGVTKEQIEARIQHKAEAITEGELRQLRQTYAGIRDGMMTAAEYFEAKEETPVQKAATRSKQEGPEASESPADDKVQRNELVGKIVVTLKGFGLSIPQVLPELAARELFDAGRQPADVIKLPIETLARIAEQAEAIGAEAKERRAGE